MRKFSFEKGLYGQGAKSVDDIGIEFADGSILGSKDNVKLRFTAEYQEARRRRQALTHMAPAREWSRAGPEA